MESQEILLGVFQPLRTHEGSRLHDHFLAQELQFRPGLLSHYWPALYFEEDQIL